jgi:hypothetical protein
MTTHITPVDSYRIDLPLSWKEIPIDDLSPRTLLLSETPQWKSLGAPQRRRIELFLSRIEYELKSTNTTFAAMFADLVEEESEPTLRGDEPDDDSVSDTTNELLTGSCTISTITRAEMGTPLQLRPEALLQAMSVTGAGVDQSPVNLEPPSIVTLNAGRAVRLVRFVGGTLQEPEDGLFIESFLVPIEPDFESVAMIQFTTPNYVMAPFLSELFGSIAQTFRIYRDGDPTTV